MSTTSIGTTGPTTTTTWAARPRTGDSGAAFEQVAATVAARRAVPSAYDSSWMSENLSAQDRTTITATTGVRFGATGSILVPMSASPDDSHALQKAVHLLDSRRGGFPEDLTPEEVLRLVRASAPGADPEPLRDTIERARSDGRVGG